MMLIHRICMALSGLGRPSTVDNAIRDSAAILLTNKHFTTNKTTNKQNKLKQQYPNAVIFILITVLKKQQVKCSITTLQQTKANSDDETWYSTQIVSTS